MNTVEIIIKFLPFVGFLTFLKVTWEYIQSQRWKKSEFLSKEIKEFQNDNDTKIVFQLLDWNTREVNLRGSKVIIDDEILSKSLMTHNQRQNFEPFEADLRDIFDRFFDRISTFQIYVQNGLIRERELYLYIGYYIKILNDENRKPKELINSFNNYLNYYEYKNVLKLIESFKKYR